MKNDLKGEYIGSQSDLGAPAHQVADECKDKKTKNRSSHCSSNVHQNAKLQVSEQSLVLLL